MADAEAYREAYLIGRAAFVDSAGDVHLLAGLRHLTAQLRSDCMVLASEKRDVGPGYLALDGLLKEANKMTGEDMYGHLGP
jgi:hypothetical protein